MHYFGEILHYELRKKIHNELGSKLEYLKGKLPLSEIETGNCLIGLPDSEYFISHYIWNVPNSGQKGWMQKVKKCLAFKVVKKGNVLQVYERIYGAEKVNFVYQKTLTLPRA